VSVLLGNDDGSFQDQRDFPVEYGPRSVAVADVNGDASLILVVANSADTNTPPTTTTLVAGSVLRHYSLVAE